MGIFSRLSGKVLPALIQLALLRARQHGADLARALSLHGRAWPCRHRDVAV